MAKSKSIPEKYQMWINARKRFHLSNSQIQMAREFGMNPKNFGKLNNHKQETWKALLPVFIENLYFKNFKKEKPDNVKSIEQIYKEHENKKLEVFCDEDACIIAGSEKKIREYISKMKEDNISNYTIKKTRFYEIMNGIKYGAAYCFDEEAHNRFYPIAHNEGLEI